jgi:peptide/nickel transport system substrate-binding protein
MKKGLILVSILLVFVLLLVGCSSQSTTTSAPPAPQTTQAQQTTAAAPTTTKAPAPAATTTAAAAPTTTKAPAATTTAASSDVPGAYPASLATPKQVSGGILKILDMRLPTGSVGNPAKILPQDFFFLYPAIETIVRVDPNGNPQPMLATSWQVASDLSSITFKVRQGVKFQDGTDLNATVVAWNFNNVIAAKVSGTSNWTKAEVIDDYTVKLGFSSWSNLLYSNLAGRPGAMVSQAAIQKNGENWANTNIVGTGSFLLSKFTKDTQLDYVRNPNYWQKGKPFLDGISYICIPDLNTQLAAFKKKDADMLEPWDGQLCAQAMAVPNTVSAYRDSGANCILPDAKSTDMPYSKKEVRYAIEYAIDKTAIEKIAGYGVFKQANQPSCPTTVGFVKDVTPRSYNIAKAKELLTLAGYPNGFETTLAITQNSASTKDTQVAIQTMLAAVGIKCKLTYADPATYADYMQNGWHNILIYAPGGGAGLGTWAGGIETYYTNPKFYPSLKAPDNIMDLYTKAKSSVTVDIATQTAIGQAMFDYCSVIPIIYMGTSLTTYDYVHEMNFLSFPGPYHYTPENAWMSK